MSDFKEKEEVEAALDDIESAYSVKGGFEGPEAFVAIHKSGAVYIHYKDPASPPQLAKGYPKEVIDNLVEYGTWVQVEVPGQFQE